MEILTTERLKLRYFQSGDEPFVLELLNDPSFLRFIGDKGVRTLQDATEYLHNGPIASYLKNGYGLFHAAELSSGASAGMCGLLLRDGCAFADIGFAFLPAYQAKGFAFEAATATLAYGHQEHGMQTIDAFVDPDNQRSIRLLGRLGMHYEGLVTVAGIGDETCLYRLECSGS